MLDEMTSVSLTVCGRGSLKDAKFLPTCCTSGSRSVGKTSCNVYATLSQTRIVLTRSKGMVGG
ncbi:hypothetical protein BS47DRAFT_1350179 [Hydnum rufescens UP504]|uniref:Uncharacterized protein n=1 Tax=Hydnum rufescens UP504 TaxID=1448309 RepID=A0A9P6ANA9_9AGAM|nr:hypothetical protein BS47DRAFT_1350179 [Hydnum rufescens UP504]